MIIIKLKGGLGNQIFQYCFGRALSYDLGKELFVDLSFFNHGLYRHGVYGLHPYNIKGNVGYYPYHNINNFKIIFKIIYNIRNFPLIKNNSLLTNFTKKLENNTSYGIKFFFKEPEIYHSTDIIDENIYSFDNIKTPAYFEGNYQFNTDSKNRAYISEKFFKKHLELIHKDLKYLPPLSKESQEIANDMKNSNSILLHVRHGDYTGLHDFGLCSEEYYEKSIELMVSKIQNPKFFIFSDDIEGAKKLKINYPHVFVDFKENLELNGRGNGELLKLMSTCNHFIIANSSLSWWAAFLSENEDKIIITPEPWFQNRRVLGAETIDNKIPIKITNNNKRLFNESERSILKLNEEEFSFKNIDFKKIGNNYKIKNIKNNSRIILKNKKAKQNRFIIKVSLESNHFNCFKILFKTKKNSENTFNLYYYEDDDFDQYFLFPEDTVLDSLKIIPGSATNNPKDYVIIKSLEIKKVNK